ncbi:hypothetical protein EON67_10620 [archaeon]|nr:MAG: hypothetical protein EON67_10620 [archaeon]
MREPHGHEPEHALTARAAAAAAAAVAANSHARTRTRTRARARAHARAHARARARAHIQILKTVIRVGAKEFKAKPKLLGRGRLLQQLRDAAHAVTATLSRACAREHPLPPCSVTLQRPRVDRARARARVAVYARTQFARAVSECTPAPSGAQF